MSEENDAKETGIDTQRVIDELGKRGATNPCARCGHQSFAIERNFITLQVQNSLKTLSIGGTTIPAAVVVCKNCGAITLHAFGVLGLLPQSDGSCQEPQKAPQSTTEDK